MVFDVFNKKPNQQSFDANVWRNERRVEQNVSTNQTNLVLGTLFIIMVIGVGTLFAHHTLSNKKANTAVPLMVQSEVEGFPSDSAPVSKLATTTAKAPASTMADIKSQLTMYRQTTSSLAMCGSQMTHVLKYYRNQNEAKYKKLQELKKQVRSQEPGGMGPGMIGFPNSELGNIKTEADAMKFVLSGKAQKQMQASMNNMSNLMSQLDNLENQQKQMAVNSRDKNYCSQMASKAQTGQLHLRIPKI